MLHKVWAGENRKLTVCIDSYADGVLKGRIFDACQEVSCFESLVQFLLAVEAVLEEQQIPQSYTSLRKFSEFLPAGEENGVVNQIGKGAKATFSLQVLFRQHSSWQGVIVWRDQKKEESFRSVLELVMLMDSALRTEKEGAA